MKNLLYFVKCYLNFYNIGQSYPLAYSPPPLLYATLFCEIAAKLSQQQMALSHPSSINSKYARSKPLIRYVYLSQGIHSAQDPAFTKKIYMSKRISETAVLKDNQFPVLYPSLSVLGFVLGGKIN